MDDAKSKGSCSSWRNDFPNGNPLTEKTKDTSPWPPAKQFKKVELQRAQGRKKWGGPPGKKKRGKDFDLAGGESEFREGKPQNGPGFFQRLILGRMFRAGREGSRVSSKA